MDGVVLMWLTMREHIRSRLMQGGGGTWNASEISVELMANSKISRALEDIVHESHPVRQTFLVSLS